jgi:hypothetical protein
MGFADRVHGITYHGVVRNRFPYDTLVRDLGAVNNGNGINVHWSHRGRVKDGVDTAHRVQVVVDHYDAELDLTMMGSKVSKVATFKDLHRHAP